MRNEQQRGWTGRWMRTLVVGAAMGAATAPASLSHAQEQEAPAPQRPLLRGPRISDDRPPGLVESFAPGDRRLDRLPERLYQSVLQELLMGEDAPAETRVTPEQRAKIDAIVETFQQERRAFQQKYGAELRELRAVGEARARGDRPDRGADDEAMAGPDEDQRARQIQRVRERMRQINAEAPRAERTYALIWEELNEAQRAAVETRLEAHRQRLAREREETYVQRRMEQRGVTPPPVTDRRPDGMMGPDDAPTDRARPRDAVNPRRERLMRLFDRLPPEEQEMLLDRLEQHLRQRLAEPRRDSDDAGQRRPGRKPPPDKDRIRVPDPDKDGGR